MQLKNKPVRTRSSLRSTRPVRHGSRSAFDRLEDRRLFSASLAVSSSLMVFNAVNGSTSATESLTLTNTGNASLTLGSSAFSIVGGNSSQFAVTNASSAPASLAAGASFVIGVDYHASTVATQASVLDITTNDPSSPAAVTLHGIGTVGQYGSNQPSLATILQAYNIPTYVGEGFDDANAASDSVYPTPPDASSQEVVMPRLVKAGTGPVTIQVLASFDAAATEPYTLGYYSPGNTSTKTELFYTPTSESQSVYIQPQGSTEFDPGSADFGFYFVSNILDSGVNRVGYSEDDLNTFDTTVPRKFRFFPDETANGTVIPNTYIMTSTEYNAPAGYDFTNLVAIVSNVTAATSAPVLKVSVPNLMPGSNVQIFSQIQTQNASAGGDIFHNTNTITLENTGTTTLTINSYTLSSNWGLVNPPTFPLTVAANASTTLTIKFTASTEPSVPYNETNGGSSNEGGAYYGSLILNSNDPYNSTDTLPLAGWWQSISESDAEPSLQTTINLLAGYKTNINPTPISLLTESSTSTATYYGQEVVSSSWSQADSSRPVSVMQVEAAHTEGNTATLYWYQTGTTSYHSLFVQAAHDGQTYFPLTPSNTSTSALFTPTSSFAWRVDAEDSLDSKQSLKTGAGHHFRFYPVVDANGNPVPNTYIMTMDYSSTPVENFDFQDNVYIVTNIHPVTTTTVSSPQTTAAPPMPTDATAITGNSGVTLEWAPVTYTPLAGYDVYRSTNGSSGPYTLINTGGAVTATTYIDSSAPSGSSLYYKITAVDSSSLVQSLGTQVATTTSAAVQDGSISGTIFQDNNGNGIYDSGDTTLAGWGVFIDNNATGAYNASNDIRVFSSSNGTFTFSNLVPGTYRIAEATPVGYNRTEPTGSYYTITVTAGQAVTGINFGVSTYGTITGTMFEDFNGNSVQDAGEPVLNGWGVFLDYSDNGVFGGSDVRVFTNSSGVYSFGNLPAGTYYLSQNTPTGWRRETPAVLPYAVTVVGGQPTVVNFAEAQAAIYGTVFNDKNQNGAINSGETGYSGFGVFIDNNGTGVFNPINDQRTFTDSSGDFRFLGLLPGTYNIQEQTPAGYTRTTPGSAGFTLTVTAGQILSGENFGYIYTATPTAQAADEVAGPAVTSPTFSTMPVLPTAVWDEDLKKKHKAV